MSKRRKKAERQKRGKIMTDNFGEGYVIEPDPVPQESPFTPDTDVYEDAVPEHVEAVPVEPVYEEASTPVDVSVQEPLTERPKFGIEYGKYFGSGRGAKNSGPEVVYINNKFGIDGDTFTKETSIAVRKWQRENGFYASGTVDFEQYVRM